MTAESILEICAKSATDYFDRDITVEKMKTKTRRREYCIPRQLAVYFMSKKLGITLKSIADTIGFNDHSTVIHAINRVEDMLFTNDVIYVGLYDMVERTINLHGKENTAVITLPMFTDHDRIMKILNERYNITGYIIGKNPQTVNY